MRRLIVSELISLDGIVEAPGGDETAHPHGGWTTPFRVPGAGAYKLREALEAESLLLGRITYEGFSVAWPQQEGEFAVKMNTMPKHVVTSTLHELGWNASVIAGNVPSAVETLRAGEGGPILVYGSATLVRTLLSHGLIDELRLMVFPVMIGGGLSMFPRDHQKLEFELTEFERYSNGVVRQVYRPTS